MIERILAKLFPPKLGKIRKFEPEPDKGFKEEGWAGNLMEWPDGRWAKGVPVSREA